MLATNISDLSPTRSLDEWEWEETSPNGEQRHGIDAPLPGKNTRHVAQACQRAQTPLPLNTLLPVTYSTLLTSACVDTRAEAWTSLFPESMTEFLIDFLGGSGERQKHQYLDLTLSRCPLSHHSRNTPQEEEQLFISIYDPV